MQFWTVPVIQTTVVEYQWSQSRHDSLSLLSSEQRTSRARSRRSRESTATTCTVTDYWIRWYRKLPSIRNLTHTRCCNVCAVCVEIDSCNSNWFNVGDNKSIVSVWRGLKWDGFVSKLNFSWFITTRNAEVTWSSSITVIHSYKSARTPHAGTSTARSQC